jgi:S-adenosylmethionine:diacylglycerol 3-amino-3-carboxypropyl transferase
MAMKFLFNYTFANEDNFTEMNILKERQNIVLAIAGSGSRVIPLFAKKPKNMTCVDISSSQLHLTEMRIQAIRQLTHQEYCVLLGYIRSESKLRKAIFEKLDLSPETKKSLWEYFESLGWNSLLFAGEWEKDLSKTTALFQLLIPDLRQKINSCDNLDQQLNLYYEIKPKIKIIKAILFASSLSYSIRNVFSSNNNHLKMSGIIHMISAFDAHMYKVFSRFLIKESFYYSILFTGQYFSYQAPTPEIDEKMC